MTDSTETPAAPKASWRMTLGTWMFAVPFAMVLGAPVVIPFLGLTGPQTAALIGGIVVAGEVIWFASIPLLGKEGFLAMKKKTFGFLKLPDGPISPARHWWGVWLLLLGLGGQLLLQAVMIIAYAIVGAHPERVLLGMSFEQQLGVYFSVLILCVIFLIAGVYALGAGFAERIKRSLEYSATATGPNSNLEERHE